MKNFEMTQDQLDVLMDAGKPVPRIALNCGTLSSPQETANAAWRRLGGEMGFDHMTVRPNGKGDRFFSALKLLRSFPLLLVSSLATRAWTFPSRTAGPKLLSSLLIWYDEFGKFFFKNDSRTSCLLE